MGDDFITDGILSSNSGASDDADFDPNAVESDDFLDDPEDVLLDDNLVPAGVQEDDEEDDDLFGEDE